MTDALRLGVAGLGTVGCALIQLLAKQNEILEIRSGRTLSVTGVSARTRGRDRGISIDHLYWHDDPVTLATADNIDVFVELIGGDSGPADLAVRAALESGKHVVTANKALLAKHGGDLARLAEANGVSLNFEAAVAGGIPVIKAMRESLAGNQVSRVSGILNGTCNYILTRMEEDNISFSACLEQAQKLGYAEADPTFDVEGYDTAHKLSLLTSLAFGTEVNSDEIYIEGISSITPQDIQAATELGYRIRLLGVAQKLATGIEQRVHPTMVPLEGPLAQITDVTNAVSIDADAVGNITMSGPGAGGDATASAVLGDIVDIARGVIVPTLGIKVADQKPYVKARMRAHEGGYYIRLTVSDRLGAFASIAGRMAEAGISLASIVQKNRDGQPELSNGPETKTVLLITHKTTESAIREALVHIRSDGHIVGDPQLIRLEKA
ncbi:homoserine dehydrogenase [Pararhizobium sp. IMCC21322]|uniref:homoserine dehydrogenase n=1 Tax=Pararhizobium sp. IMCC21322 TaxID=3067903 RepID=UPI0027409B61|nr:homoserine dehydrogenase [Pararhizobium sp. IMCC21322]